VLLRWSPDEGEPVEYQFVPAQLRSAEGEAIEGVGGDVWDTFSQFSVLFNRGNLRALRAALWSCRRRDEPNLRFESIDVGVLDIQLDFGDAELASIRQALETADLDPEQRAHFVKILGADPGDSSGPKDPPLSGPPSSTTASLPDEPVIAG
jgi:hypothetical protein